MKPMPKKRKKEDPFRSAADIEEQEAFEKRNFQIKVMLFVGIPIVLVLLYFLIDYGSQINFE